MVYDLFDFSYGFIIVIVLIGIIIGVFVCSKLVEKYGCLKVLKIIVFFYFVFVVGSVVIIDWYFFLFFCFVGGLVVGVLFVVGFMYIVEIFFLCWCGCFVVFF